MRMSIIEASYNGVKQSGIWTSSVFLERENLYNKDSKRLTTMVVARAANAMQCFGNWIVSNDVTSEAKILGLTSLTVTLGAMLGYELGYAMLAKCVIFLGICGSFYPFIAIEIGSEEREIPYPRDRKLFPKHWAPSFITFMLCGYMLDILGVKGVPVFETIEIPNEDPYIMELFAGFLTLWLEILYILTVPRFTGHILTSIIGRLNDKLRDAAGANE